MMKLTRNTVLFILLLAVVVQSAIILYNNYTGYVPLSGWLEFGVRLVSGSVMSALVAGVLLWVDGLCIVRLDARLPWREHAGARAVLESLGMVLIGAMLGVVLTLLVNIPFPYREGVLPVLVTNASITAVVNLLLAVGLEALLQYRHRREMERAAERLLRDNVTMQFEVLKKQLDPHFLFNALNVLSSLIRSDAEAAERFVNEFAGVYRYTLEVIERPLVPLRQELQLASSYMYLQSIRFRDAIDFHIDVPEEARERRVPPLSLQILLENALKHNVASPSAPLRIQVGMRDGDVLVCNARHPRPTPIASTGIGLENLRRRCLMALGREPEVRSSEQEYCVVLPSMPGESRARRDH